MSKKIIAVSLALFMIVTCFVACGKKYETTKINGEEVILVTDENGEPVINENNELIALVTDSAGEVLTYSNGEDQTRYITLKDALEITGVAYGENYKMNILEGWELGADSKLYKKDTDNKCYISVTKNSSFSVDNTIDDYFVKLDEQDEQLKEGFKTQGYDYVVEKKPITVDKYNGWHYTYRVTDNEGKIIHYAENYYFIVLKTLHSVNYACVDGVGYDETFVFENYVKANFTYID